MPASCGGTGIAHDASPAISVIIVNRDGAHLLPRCLHALSVAAVSLDVEIIVVDNGSTDGSIDVLDEGGWDVLVIRMGSNAGFSRAVNAGVRRARGRHYLLLNTDCFVQPDLLATLLYRLEASPSAAAVGPRLHNLDGSPQPSCHNFPTPLVLLLEQTMLWRWLHRIPVARRRLLLASNQTRATEVDWLTGACLLVRSDAFRSVGGLDEGFFFYWEEADLCRQLRGNGWTVLFEPAARAIHIGGGSSRAPAETYALFFESLFYFYRKHYSRYNLALARALVLLLALCKACRAGAAYLHGAVDPAGRLAAATELRGWLAVLGARGGAARHPRSDPDRTGMAPHGVALRRRLADDAARVGGRAAVSRHVDTANERELFFYMTDERSADWRFLLPEPPRGTALLLGGALSPVPLILAGAYRRVVVAGDADELAFLASRARQEGIENVEVVPADRSTPGMPDAPERFDLVAVLRPSPGTAADGWIARRLVDAAARVTCAGTLYAEIARPALCWPPALTARLLRGHGFARAAPYWPKPTFNRCEALLPLDDHRLHAYYARHIFFAMSARRRLLRYALVGAARLRLFPLIVPAYCVVATRHGDSRRQGERQG